VKVTILADAAYMLGTDTTATVTIADNEAVAIRANPIKTAAEAGYTIIKLTSVGANEYYDISGNQVVWQEGKILKLFNGTTTKQLSTETAPIGGPAFGVNSYHWSLD
jgi:hypothetical protein